MVDYQATVIRERLAMRRRRRRITHIGVVAVVIAVALAWLYWSYRSSVGTGHPAQPVTVLVGVVDGPERIGRTGEAPSDATDVSGADTPGDRALQAAALVVIDPQRRSVTVINVPASTWPGGPDDGEEASAPAGEAALGPDSAGDPSVAEAYAREGMDGLARTVKGLVGLPVHHRVRLDLAGFAALIDDIPGGVPVAVRSPIVYRDGSGNEIFRLDPGVHVLDGEAALYYLRYRGDDWTGEVPRALRQRDFARALADRLLGGDMGLQDMKNFVVGVRGQVDTDLQLVQGVRLGEMIWRTDARRVTYMLLPGRARRGRWVPDPEAMEQVARRLWPDRSDP